MTDQRGIRAVVFDFDGVILESADVKTEAFGELYAEHGPEVVDRVRAHHLANVGISRFKKFAWIAEHVLGQPLSDDDSAALGRRFTDLALEKVLESGAHRHVVLEQQTRPFPGCLVGKRLQVRMRRCHHLRPGQRALGLRAMRTRACKRRLYLGDLLGVNSSKGSLLDRWCSATHS